MSTIATVANTLGILFIKLPHIPQTHHSTHGLISMKFTGVLLALAAFCLPYVTANPTPAKCLSSTDANTLATNFGKLISNYSNKLANQTLTPDFVDYSESVNSLVDKAGTTPRALLGLTFASRAQFEKESAAQPSVPLQIKNVW